MRMHLNEIDSSLVINAYITLIFVRTHLELSFPICLLFWSGWYLFQNWQTNRIKWNDEPTRTLVYGLTTWQMTQQPLFEWVIETENNYPIHFIISNSLLFMFDSLYFHPNRKWTLFNAILKTANIIIQRIVLAKSDHHPITNPKCGKNKTHLHSPFK